MSRVTKEFGQALMAALRERYADPAMKPPASLLEPAMRSRYPILSMKKDAFPLPQAIPQGTGLQVEPPAPIPPSAAPPSPEGAALAGATPDPLADALLL